MCVIMLILSVTILMFCFYCLNFAKMFQQVPLWQLSPYSLTTCPCIIIICLWWTLLFYRWGPKLLNPNPDQRLWWLSWVMDARNTQRLLDLKHGGSNISVSQEELHPKSPFTQNGFFSSSLCYFATVSQFNRTRRTCLTVAKS